jgi:predicted RNA binding protein YcfA (HicA-like mRNA interferase family)
MPKRAKDVAAGLEAKGFRRENSKDVHYRLFVDGKKTIVYTMISHGEKEIHDGLLGTMARQVKLTRKLFNDLIECPLTFDEYIMRLRKAGVVANPKDKSSDS